MYGIEIIGSVILCVSMSFLTYFLTRRSLTQTDIILPNEDIRPKNKTTKKSPKTKLAKKEIVSTTNIKKDEEEGKVVPTQKTTKKEKKVKVEASINVSTTTVEKIRTDSSDDWKKVSKPAKKSGKKEGRVDVKEESVLDTNEINAPDMIIPELHERSILSEKTLKTTKTKKSLKNDLVKVEIQQTESLKETKKETAKESEVKTKQHKETVVDEIKKHVTEDIELRQRVGELMSDLDREKSTHREENKVHILTTNQLNKELESLKQKMKTTQLNEEKLMEEIKKKNSSFNDFKQQFVIVQSELTKNIVQVQASNREKEKLENRIKLLEENNMHLREKSEMFDRVNSEKESIAHRLASVEEEFKSTTAKYNELAKTKEVESTEKINQLQSDRQKMQEQLVRVQTDLIENNTKLQSMQQELLNTKNSYTDILNENRHLQKNYVALEAVNQQIKQQQCSETNIRERDNGERMTQLMTEIDHLKTVNDKFAEENQVLLKKCQESESNQSTHDILNERVASLTQELNNVNQHLSESRNDSSSDNVTEINELKSGNDKLRIELDDTVSALLKLQTSFTEEETKWSENLVNLKNEWAKKEELLTNEVIDVKLLLSEANAVNKTHQETYDKLVIERNELITERDNLLALVEHYKSGLENTESILSNLQISVNEEEAKWRESLLKSESEAEKCSKELETVHNELMRITKQRAEKNELNFAYHCVDKSLSSLIDEMEARMNHFETSLEAVIQERDSALAQVHVQINGTVNESIEVHSTSVNGDDNNDCDIIKIKEDLDNQVELNKSLENHCNKYKALIEIGKDALAAEKVQVQSLKEELQLLKCKISDSSEQI